MNAIPYWHFGARTSMPVSKTETIGFQLFNGWNNVSKSNGGVSGAFTSALVKPKYTWDLNYLVGPENYNTTSGLRNLIDTTLLLTPPGKFNAYINYDYGLNQRRRSCAQGDNKLMTGRAWPAHSTIRRTQRTPLLWRGLNTSTIPNGFQTGTVQLRHPL